MSRRKHKGPGGRRPGPGRPPSDDPHSVRRELRLTPDEADAHDAARGDVPWSEWMREAARIRIAGGAK